MCELQRCWRRLCYLWADPSSPSTPLFFQSLRLAQLNKLLPLAACFSRDHGDINLLIELQSSRLTAQLQQQVAIRDGAKIGICGVKLGFCFLRKETKGLRDRSGRKSQMQFHMFLSRASHQPFERGSHWWAFVPFQETPQLTAPHLRGG